MKKILLHICCGVCAAWSIQKLRQDGYEVCGLFYNPNIFPESEYIRRLETVRNVCIQQGIRLIEGDYDAHAWRGRMAGLEREPEGGLRCDECFRFRIGYTLDIARAEGIQFITTTLPISPHKDFGRISQIGRDIAGDAFIPYNFKKEDGFKRTNEYAKSHNLYRQHYCGCEFSIRNGI
jgi:hypothetical protein